MKKIFVSFFAIFAFFVFFSCKQDDDTSFEIPSSCTVTLYANGGAMSDGSSVPYTVAYGKNFVLPSVDSLGLTRENFHFKGWAESSDVAEIFCNDEAALTIRSDLKLYAIWIERTTETFYISGTGSDETGNGTEESPFATLTKAVGKMTSKYTDYVCVVAGSVTTSTVSFNEKNLWTSNLLASSITVKGKTGSETDSISGNNSAIFFISTEKIPIVIENITLKNGSGYDLRGSKVGGAVYVESVGKSLSFSNVIFSENSADYGAGIFNNSNGTVTLSNCKFLQNSAQKTGGAVHNEGTMTLEKCTVSKNIATEKGGGIYNKASLSLKETTISENSAQNGGGICNIGTVEMNSKCEISKNTAEGRGAGIYTTGTFKAESSESEISENILSSDSGIGAGIYNNGSVTLYANVKNHDIQGNGAAVYNDTNGAISFARGEISGNTAKNGGAFFNAGSLSIAGGEISNNTATAYGGAIYSTGTLSISGGEIQSNEAENGGGFALFGESQATFSKGTVSKNTAAKGGGFYIEEATLSMVENPSGTPEFCEIKDNQATLYGGGVYLKSGSLIVNAGIVSAYGKRKNSSANSSTYYSGNKAGENTGTSTEGMYAECGNSWFSEDGTVKKSGETLVGTEIAVDGKTCHYSDEDVVAGVDGWSAIVD